MKMPSLGLKKTFSFIFIFILINGVSANELTLFFINTYNLFDTAHDKGKQDYAYLPRHSPLKKKCNKVPSAYRRACFRRDWTQDKLSKKINNLCHLISISKAQVIGLVEVENKKVLKQLANHCGFKTYYITEGQDQRGIDQAVLVKKQKGLSVEEVSDIPVRGYRPLLKLKMGYGKKKFSLYITHWPSQRSATKKRIEKAKLIRKKLNLKEPILVMGDFNIVSEEEAELVKEWPLQNLTPGKTYFYPKEMKWSNFDRIYANKVFLEKFNVNKDKTGVYNPRILHSVYEYNDPKKKYYGSRIIGIPNRKYSDHFPVIFTFN